MPLKTPLSEQGITTNARIFDNLGRAQLIEHALANGEGRLAADGPLVVDTGRFTGRSVKDKFVVKDEMTQDTINWGAINQPMSAGAFREPQGGFPGSAEGRGKAVCRRPVRRFAA